MGWWEWLLIPRVQVSFVLPVVDSFPNASPPQQRQVVLHQKEGPNPVFYVFWA